VSTPHSLACVYIFVLLVIVFLCSFLLLFFLYNHNIKLTEFIEHIQINDPCPGLFLLPYKRHRQLDIIFLCKKNLNWLAA